MISTSLRSSSNRTDIHWTDRSDGDLGITAGPGVEGRRRVVHPAPWSWLRQVHGPMVHRVLTPGGVQGVEGDAIGRLDLPNQIGKPLLRRDHIV